MAHRHELDRLWNQAESIAGELPGYISEADLKHLTKYAGEFLYPAQGARELDPGASGNGSRLQSAKWWGTPNNACQS